MLSSWRTCWVSSGRLTIVCQTELMCRRHTGDEGENRSGHGAADGGPACPVKESPEKGGLARASACSRDQESCGQSSGTSATGVAGWRSVMSMGAPLSPDPCLLCHPWPLLLRRSSERDMNELKYCLRIVVELEAPAGPLPSSAVHFRFSSPSATPQ